jgi:hypothetical protein
MCTGNIQEEISRKCNKSEILNTQTVLILLWDPTYFNNFNILYWQAISQS